MHHGNPEIEMAVIGADDQLVGLDREYREKIDMRSALCDQFCAHLSGGLDPEGPDHKIPTGQQPFEPARRPRQYLMSQSIDISRRIRRQGDGESIRKLGEGKRFTIRLSSGNGTVRMVCKAIPRQSVGRVAGAGYHRENLTRRCSIVSRKIRDNGLPAVYRRTAILRALSVLFRLIAGITACRGEISEQSKAILDDDLGRELARI